MTAKVSKDTKKKDIFEVTFDFCRAIANMGDGSIPDGYASKDETIIASIIVTTEDINDCAWWIDQYVSRIGPISDACGEEIRNEIERKPMKKRRR